MCLVVAYLCSEDLGGCVLEELPNACPRSELLTMQSPTDTAQEIVAGLGEIAGAARAEGLREILEISEGGGGQKKGQILYDFMAQGTYLRAPDRCFRIVSASQDRTGPELSAQETNLTA